jgi:hypothetical protein
MGSSQQFDSRSARLSLANISINIADLRTEVARRHNFINRILLGIIASAAGALFFWLARLALLYRKCVQYCGAYDFVLPMNVFLTQNLTAVGEGAESDYHQRRQQMQNQTRTDYFYRREKEETQRRLQTLLDGVRDDQQRLSIQTVLDSGDLEEIHVLLDQLQPQAAQRAPEERLQLLLESIKEYCTEDQFQNCRNDALDVFHRSGFREARDLIVKRHVEFRARAKALSEEEENKQSGQTTTPHI